MKPIALEFALDVLGTAGGAKAARLLFDRMHPLIYPPSVRDVEARDPDEVADSIEEALSIREEIVMQQDQYLCASEAIDPVFQVVRVASRVEQLTMPEGCAFERGFGIANPAP